MSSDRWHQIEELYHAALRLDANQRAAFLESACNGEADLRREVESLLASDQQAESFLESPVLEVAAKAMAAEGPPSLGWAPSWPLSDSFCTWLRRYGRGL
jgi:eukaryotic-like serine/threonine-protein kinase